MKVAIIGGGAAGFFAAINVVENFPDAQVELLERTSKVLSKVRVSGGGRCNVTNVEEDIERLFQAYPRGSKFMKRALNHFSTTDIKKWFTERGVPLVAEDDGRVFPKTNSSQTIIDCLSAEAGTRGVKVNLSCGVERIEPIYSTFKLYKKGNELIGAFDKVIVTTGGYPKREGFEWLEDLGHRIEDPVPSLFTFNMPDEAIKELPGLSVNHAIASIPGTKLRTEGPLLVTHWGMSGPAILKLSAFAAKELNRMNYVFEVRINWTGITNEDQIGERIRMFISKEGKKKLSLANPFQIPRRLWHFLIYRYELKEETPWNEIGSKQINKLTAKLSNDLYHVNGKTTYKEEFVTCGGVSLKSIDLNTMMSKACPGLYFAGEILDIDGITGGYNFQAAWTTAFMAARLGEG